MMHFGVWFAEFTDILLIAAGLAVIAGSYAVPALAGVLGKAVRVSGLVLILVGGCRLYTARAIAAHDLAFASAQTAVVAEARLAAFKAGAESAAAEARDQAARVAATTTVRTVIIHDGPTAACRATPAFNSAADELRRRASSRAGSPSGSR